MINCIKEYMPKSRKKQRIYIILVVLLFLCFYSMSYGDVLITTTHGINFWDCLFSGNINHFYENNLNVHLVSGIYNGYYSALYDFVIYIIFAIWDFPLWIAQNCFGVKNVLNTFLGVAWAKSISLFFLIATIIVFVKISNIIQKDKEYIGKVCLLFFTSIYCIAYIFVLGQYDSITVFFMLLGIYYLLNDNMKGFLLSFMIANSIKIFSLLTFFVLLIYREKNALKIIFYLVLSLMLILPFRILIPFASASNMESFMDMVFFTNKINFSFGYISIFVVLYLCFCLYVYFFNTKTIEHDKIIYYSFIVNILFALTCFALPYWFFYFVPFMYLLFVMNRENYLTNIVLETISSGTVVIAQMYTFYWCFSSSIMTNLLVSKIYSKNNSGYNFTQLLPRILGNELFTSISPYLIVLLISVFFACTTFFVIINKPKNHYSKGNINLKYADFPFLYELILFVRIVFLMIVFFIPILCYIVG